MVMFKQLKHPYFMKPVCRYLHQKSLEESVEPCTAVLCPEYLRHQFLPCRLLSAGFEPRMPTQHKPGLLTCGELEFM